jgi:hypothetical protein
MDLKEFAREMVKQAWSPMQFGKAIHGGFKTNAGLWATGVPRKSPGSIVKQVQRIAERHPEALVHADRLGKAERRAAGTHGTSIPYSQELKKSREWKSEKFQKVIRQAKKVRLQGK